MKIILFRENIQYKKEIILRLKIFVFKGQIEEKQLRKKGENNS